MSLHIEVKTIPHNEQRYDTCGDYYEDKKTGIAHFNISDLGNWEEELCVALHEIIEWALVTRAGVPLEVIDNFDIKFELTRKEDNEAEPGDDPLCPYREMHFFATTIERLVSQKLGIIWNEYDAKIQRLNYESKADD